MEEIQPQMKSVMVIGRREYVLSNVRRLLEREGYTTFGLLEEQEDLVKRLFQKEYDLVLIGGGVDPHVQSVITDAMTENRSETPVMRFSGGPANLLPEVQKLLPAS